MAGLNVSLRERPSDDIRPALSFLYSSPSQCPASSLCPGKTPRHLLLFSRCLVQATSDTFKEMSQTFLWVLFLDHRCPAWDGGSQGLPVLLLTNNNDANHGLLLRTFLAHLVSHRAWLIAGIQLVFIE